MGFFVADYNPVGAGLLAINGHAVYLVDPSAWIASKPAPTEVQMPVHHPPVGAAAGCDLLILHLKDRSLRLLQGRREFGAAAVVIVRQHLNAWVGGAL